MKYFGKFFIFLLKILLCILLLGALTVLSWWMRWPIGTGCAIFAGILGIVLLIVIGRKLWRWRNKKNFIRSVLTEQQEEAAPFAGGATSVEQIWTAGKAYLEQSPLHRIEKASLAQPWFMVLDPAADANLFNLAGKSLPLESERPLRWHFFHDSIFLQFHSLHENTAHWENLLHILVENRKNVRFKGVLVTLDIQELLNSTTENLHTLALLLRDTIQQLMLAFDAALPVHVLITHIETLSGMETLLNRLPDEGRENLLGKVFATPSAHAGAEAIHKAVSQLRRRIDEQAASGVCPKEGDLKALETLLDVTERLDGFMTMLCGPLPHQVTPALRSINFAQTPTEHHTSGTFLREFLQNFLPHDTAQPQQLRGGFSLYASTKAYCYAALLLCTLSICGAMAVNTIYQASVLREYATLPQKHISDNTVVNKFYNRMLHILSLEKEYKAWILPSFGHDVLGHTIAALKEKFSNDIFSTIINPAIRNSQTIAQNKKITVENYEEMLWYTGIIADKMDSGHVKESDAARYPLTSTTEQIWTVYTGAILANAVNWTTDTQMLAASAGEMRQAVAMFFIRSPDVFNETLKLFDIRNETRKICLSQYWPHLPLNDELNFCVPPHFTAYGLKSLQEKRNELWFIAGDNDEFMHRITQFHNRYLLDYAEIWKKFITAFDQAWQHNLQGRLYTDMGSIQDLASLPHIRLMLDLDAQLTPLQNEGFKQPWLQDFPLLHAMTKGAITQSTMEDANLFVSIITLLTNSPDILTKLHAETRSAAHLRKILLAMENLRCTFLNTSLTLRTISNTTDALSMAKVLFTGERQEKADGKLSNPYSIAQKELQKALEEINITGESPIKNIFTGMLSFVGQGVIVQAANELQDLWAMEVLSNPINLYNDGDLSVLYGEKGIVSEFIHKNLSPFVKRTSGGLIANIWNDIPFPFTEDFMTSLSRAEQIAVSPSKDSYSILLRSSPTLVNVDATKRPDMTILTLKSSKTTQTLLNRNYPRQQTIVYSPKESGEVVLEVRFPSFSLKQTYPHFSEFFESFKNGEYVFTPEDFPDQAAILKQEGIKEITVRIIADNATAALQQMHQEIPVLQKRITYTW